jgi:Segregation and condensation complex subunit ScpB
VGLSRAATEVPAIVAYRQPIVRAGIELIRGPPATARSTRSWSVASLKHNRHHLLVTTRAFLEFAGLRDLADLSPLSGADHDRERQHVVAEVSLDCAADRHTPHAWRLLNPVRWGPALYRLLKMGHSSVSTTRSPPVLERRADVRRTLRTVFPSHRDSHLYVTPSPRSRTSRTHPSSSMASTSC